MNNLEGYFPREIEALKGREDRGWQRPKTRLQTRPSNLFQKNMKMLILLNLLGTYVLSH